MTIETSASPLSGKNTSLVQAHRSQADSKFSVPQSENRQTPSREGHVQVTRLLNIVPLKEASPGYSIKVTVNGVENGSLIPGEAAELKMQVLDAAGNPVTRFDLDMTKSMHLLVVKRDLNHSVPFPHIHPNLNTATGEFTILLNQTTSDPDNQDLPHAITRPGRHFLFAQVKPQGEQEALTIPFEVRAEGQEEIHYPELDKVRRDGSILKYFSNDGLPGKFGAPYQITLKVEKMEGMVHFNFHLRAAHLSHHDGVRRVHYKDVTDLQDWLGMPGHLPGVSRTGDTPQDKVFFHAHAMEHQQGASQHGAGAGPHLTFMLMDDQVPPPGIYKIQLEVKRHDRVFHFPFVVRL